MQKLYRNTAVVFLFALFTACASVGLPTAETFNQRLAVGYGTVTEIRTTALTLLKAKKITPDDAQNINNQADNARTGLDIARTMSGTDIKAADAKLTALHTVLTGLQTYLSTRSQ